MLNTVYLHENLVEVPLPLRGLAHIVGALLTYLSGEMRSEPIDRWCQSNANQSPVFAIQQVLGGDQLAPLE